MRPYNRVLPLLCIVLLLCSRSVAQDSSLYSKLYTLPDKLFDQVNKKAARTQERLNRQTERYLKRLARQEQKLRKQLWKKDSSAAKSLFGDIEQRYQQLQQSATKKSAVYSGHLDSLQTALQFLNQRQLTINGIDNSKISGVLDNCKYLQETLDRTNNIQQYLKERQQHLRQQLEKFGLAKEFRKFKQEVYYYRAQVDEYRQMFEDPSKLEAKLLQAANAIPAFREFFSRNSMLAGMFRLPGASSPAQAAAIPGLQTRAAVQQTLLQRFGSGPDVSRAMQQGVQSAQAHINQLKQKISELGGSGSDADMPDFKPNKQRTKTFWNRIELGANVQSVRGTQFFPVTSDLALMAGYKLNNRSTVGIGAGYKMGWGQNFRNIKITHEGLSLRSFVDVQLKGSLYASGGFEYNYQQPFSNVRQLQGMEHWQRSGLIGVSKVVAVRSKLLTKTKVQVLWDFLSYNEIPRSPAIKFRVAYVWR